MSRALGITYVLLSVLLWSLIPLVSVLGQSTLDNHQFLLWSSLTSLATMLALTASQGRIRELRNYSWEDLLWAILLGFLGTYLYYLLLYLGYARASSLEVIVLQYTWPVFTVLLSVLLLGERPTIHSMLSILLGLAGTVAIITGGSSVQLSGTGAIVLIAAAVFGLFSVLSKKVELELYSMLTIYYLTATAASLIGVLLFSSLQTPSSAELLPVLANGVLVNGISYVLWIRALRLLPASFAAPFVFLTPVISTLLVVVFLHQPLLPAHVLGLVLIIASGLLNLEPTRDKRT